MLQVMRFIKVKKYNLIMPVKNNNFRVGVTLIELVVTIIAAVILLLGITGILAAGHKNFKTMFKRTSEGVVPDAYAARRAFDTVVRKASIKRYDPSTVNITPSSFIYVYYYSNPQNFNIEVPDRYAHFYQNGTQLILEQGNVPDFNANVSDLPAPTSTYILADNVYSVNFSVFMYSVKMSLILDSEIITENTNKLETLKMSVTSTAVLHNDWH
jgi:hypothetical protein